MRVLCYLAFKSLLRSRLSLAFLLLAVTAGVAFQIPNAANINGYTEELLRQGVSRSMGHLVIEPDGGRPMDGVAALMKRLRGLPFVRGVTARDAHAGVLLRGEDYRAVRAVGIDPKNEDAAAGFCGQVARGGCLDARRPRQAVAGSRLAQVLKLLLAAHARGLGACWMTGPLIAAGPLCRILQVPWGWDLAAVIPVGYPDEQPEPPRRRALKRLVRRHDAPEDEP